jgi:hypothetical protein
MDISQKPNRSVVALAIEAVEGNPHPNPLDQDMRGIGESPCDLDLPGEQPCRGNGKAPLRMADANDEQSGEAIQ